MSAWPGGAPTDSPARPRTAAHGPGVSPGSGQQQHASDFMTRTVSAGAGAIQGGSRLCEHVGAEATGSRPGEEPQRVRGRWQQPSRHLGSGENTLCRPPPKGQLLGCGPVSQTSHRPLKGLGIPLHSPGRWRRARRTQRPQEHEVPTLYSALPFVVWERLPFRSFPRKHAISNRAADCARHIGSAAREPEPRPLP